MIRQAPTLSGCGVLLTLFFSIGCTGIDAPESGQLDTVAADLNYLREVEQIAWVDKQPPATILIGWKKHPVEDFGMVNSIFG